MMDYKYIEQLLERYFQCQTTLEEERILRAFFEQEDVPAQLLQWREWFVYPLEVKQTDCLGDDFDARMLAFVNEPPVVKARTVSLRKRLRPLLRAAAVVAIVLTLGNAIQRSLHNDNNIYQPSSANHQPSATMASNDSVTVDSIRNIPFTRLIQQWGNINETPRIQ